MIEFPYLVDLLIVILGLAAAFRFGWVAHEAKYEREQINFLNEEYATLRELVEESKRRTEELNEWIEDVKAHFATCPEVRETSKSVEAKLVTNPVTGAPLGYTYPVHDWTKPDDRS